MRELQEQLMAIVGHDLRTPLSAIILNNELLMRTPGLDATRMHQATRVARSAARMRRIIGDIVDFSRLRRGKSLTIRSESVDLEQVCSCAVEELRQVYGRPIELRVAQGTRLRGDDNRLMQVVSNLVGNALQHGSPTAPVEVSAGKQGTEVVLTVHNEGEPIPPDIVPSLFEPFRRRRDDVQGERAGSLGLGLFIVNEIVKAHAGRIEVRSVRGQGTTFEVHLPSPET